MAAQPANPAQPPSVHDPLARLDLVPLKPAYRMRVRAALLALVEALTPQDLGILSALRSASELVSLGSAVARSTEGRPDERVPLGKSARNPLGVTEALVAWADNRFPAGHVLSCLTGILVNAALIESDRRRVARLAEMVRGAIHSRTQDLLVLIGGATDVHMLVQHVDRQLERSQRVHVTFAELWTHWLRNRIVFWTLSDPLQLHHVLAAGPVLCPDIDAPEIGLWGVPARDGDDQAELPSVAVGGPGFEGLSIRSIESIGTARQWLHGRGFAGLARASDSFAPEALIHAIARNAIQAATNLLDAGLDGSQENFLELAFAIATGVREIDLQDVRWGPPPDDAGVFLLPDRPAVSMPIIRPPNATDPHGLGDKLKPVASRFDWPLPPTLHTLLKRRVASESEVVGHRVFAMGHVAIGSPATNGPPDRARTRLYGTILSLVPHAAMGYGRIRMALAAAISDRFGPEAAQLLLRDSLSTSSGPAYYCALSSNAASAFLSQLLGQWFGEEVPVRAGADAFIGSRLTLADAAAREWPTALRKRVFSAIRKKGAWREALIAKRNHLAGALCAATGNRPGSSIGRLYLDSVIPELGLVVLEDKQIDLLRRTRVAATGRRWATELREYLDLVVELTRSKDAGIAPWATGVLCSAAPLFSLPRPHGEPEPLEAATLSTTMPPGLLDYDNFYRHRLNQSLEARDVDWELRHAQLGWVVSRAFVLADMSPVSAQQLGEQLGPIVDDVLAQDGWYPPGQRVTRWTWDGIPERGLVDWPAVRAEYEREHAENTARVRRDFEARRKGAEPAVLKRIAEAVEVCLPALRVDAKRRALMIAPGCEALAPVSLTPDHYALLRDYARVHGDDPTSALEGVLAEYAVHDLVVAAMRNGAVVGPEPTYRHIGFTAQLSPFMPGIGLAVRQAFAIRRRLLEVAAGNRSRDRAGLTQLCVMALTPYRDLRRSVAATGSASRAQRSRVEPAWIRVPARDRQHEVPMVIAGIAAAAIANRARQAPTARALPREQFARWMAGLLQGVLPLQDHGAQLPALVANTLQIAGLLELAGPERLVMDDYPSAAVSTHRELAERDEWPIRTASGDTTQLPVDVARQSVMPAERSGSTIDWRPYKRLTAILNVEAARRRQQRGASGGRGQRQRIERDLQSLLGEVGAMSNLGLVIQYVLHRLRYGGKCRKNLAEATLHKEVTLFGGALLAVLGQHSLRSMSDRALQETYLAAIGRKPPNMCADSLEELAKFHTFLVSNHQAPEIEFAELRRFAGPRVRHVDKGLLTRAERNRILLELEADLERERTRRDASPDAIRACELRVLTFLLLEGSGVRPESVHGLLLGDLHFFGPGKDFIHIHRSGGHGKAKTSTALGFVHCSGDIWVRRRRWVLEWLNSERQGVTDGWWKRPLVVDLKGAEYARRYMTSRVDELAKWVTGRKKARTYWLRKTHMTEHLRAVLDQPNPSARHVYRTLHAAGEADIFTPLSNYLHDAAVPVRTYLHGASSPDRSGVLAVTALRAPVLDMKVFRDRQSGESDFFRVVLDELEVPFGVAPPEQITAPPPLRRQAPLLPAHIDIYARCLNAGMDRTEAALHTGLSGLQVALLDRRVLDLAMRRGCAPWRIDGVRERSSLIRPARHIKGTEKLFTLLDAAPGEELKMLADAWVRHAHPNRLYARDVVLAVTREQERLAAQNLIKTTSIRLVYEEMGEGIGIVRVPCAQVKNLRTRRKSHADALRWILMISWLYSVLS